VRPVRTVADVRLIENLRVAAEGGGIDEDRSIYHGPYSRTNEEERPEEGKAEAYGRGHDAGSQVPRNEREPEGEGKDICDDETVEPFLSRPVPAAGPSTQPAGSEQRDSSVHDTTQEDKQHSPRSLRGSANAGRGHSEEHRAGEPQAVGDRLNTEGEAKLAACFRMRGRAVCSCCGSLGCRSCGLSHKNHASSANMTFVHFTGIAQRTINHTVRPNPRCRVSTTNSTPRTADNNNAARIE
jgi:hypothetical protein